MHHPTDRITYTTAFVTPDMDSGSRWVEKILIMSRDELLSLIAKYVLRNHMQIV